MTKPSPQILGVSGIAETPIVIQTPTIHWAGIAALPPFQMFLVERFGPNQTGKNSYEWALDTALRHEDEGLLWDEYAAWHNNTGYWPDETPMGLAKE